jgi:hypothetical protein
VACRFFQSEPDWEAVELAFLKETVTGGEPRQSTWIKTAWTSGELLVLFHAADSRPWATMTQRDEPLYEEEVVEVFLDPVGDLESYFEIEVNPLNAVCDLVLRRTQSGYRKCFAWNCEGLRTRARVDEKSWTAELAIPFASLGPGLPRPGEPWRVNFCRIDRPASAPRELSAWSPTGRPLFHVPPRFGWLDFMP